VSRDGKNTKIHALVDGLGYPVKLIFTGGNVSDCAVAVDLLSKVNISGSVVLADKAYGTLDIRTHIESQNSAYCIPPKSNALDPWDCDYWRYKERHVVECFFQKIKQFRRVATRYEKLINCFKGFVYLACIMILVK
jgi:transposase